MKIQLLLLLLLFSVGAQAQKRSIIVTVPDASDEVYITGNQESLGNWQAEKVQMKPLSEFQRVIQLDLSLPAEFKFTRGSWDSEGYISNIWEAHPNIQVMDASPDSLFYEILSWKDQTATSGTFNYPFTLQTHRSEIFDQERTIAVKLPDNYSSSKKYPVVYVLDAQSLFKPFLLNVQLLSEKMVDEDGYDYRMDNIPEVILVGVFHENRGEETGPKFDYDEDSSLYTVGSEKLKNYLIDELVPMINKKYSTASYNSIVGHSNTGHFVLNLPFFDNNPFQGIIALSVNSESPYFKEMMVKYLGSTDKTIFLGYGSNDLGWNELGEELDMKIKNNSIQNFNLKVQSFEANHSQLPALSAAAGLKFLFNSYNNFTSFLNASKMPNFNFSKYLEEYQRQNAIYRDSIEFNGDDFFLLAEMAVKDNNRKLFREVIDYADEHAYYIPHHYKFFLATEIGDTAYADETLDQLKQSKNPEDNILVIYNHPMYMDYFLKTKNSPKEAQEFFIQIHENSKDYKDVTAYLIAKIGIENGLDPKVSKRYLDYYKKHNKNLPSMNAYDLDELEKFLK